jgi:hypothetical protein
MSSVVVRKRSRATRLLVNNKSNGSIGGGYLGTSLGILHSSQAFAVGVLLCFGGRSGALADPPAGTEPGAAASSSSSDAPTPLPQENFFSSLKQAFKQDFDHEVVRGHFDVGSPPDAHRYYCLVDAKTGKRQPNGVAGQPVLRADGMTGIKASAVSLYSCVSAEQQGILVTTRYVLSGGAGGVIVPASPALKQPGAAALPDVSPDQIDVAGVKLGMSLDEARAVLKSRKLLDYYESTEALGHFDSTKGAMQPIASGRFVNVIAAWTAPPSSPVGDAFGEDGESYEVMFTPVPGKERVMAIVHSAAYSAANAVHEMALANGLVKKYGGFTGSSDLPGSPTWRIQSSGNVQVGDACDRRGIFGGLGELNVGNATRPNLALKTTPDEFRFQIDHCGVAIVTEDHSTANGGAPHEDRIITRFTVTAYSPLIGFDGATTAAQLIQTAGKAVNKTNALRTKDQPVPNL